MTNTEYITKKSLQNSDSLVVMEESLSACGIQAGNRRKKISLQHSIYSQEVFASCAFKVFFTFSCFRSAKWTFGVDQFEGDMTFGEFRLTIVVIYQSICYIHRHSDI
jgi:hypothetical protein